MSEYLDLALDGWVIADGGECYLHRGQVACFGVEFYGERINVIPTAQKRLTPINYENYRVAGEVTYRVDRKPYGLWMIDFGITATADEPVLPPPDAVVGTFVAGDVRLTVDKDYFLGANRPLQGPGFVIYTWQIEYIFAENWTHRLVPSVAPGGERSMVYEIDESSIRYHEVESTGFDACAYVSRCRRLD
jgi:hypothetical protein